MSLKIDSPSANPSDESTAPVNTWIVALWAPEPEAPS